MSGGRIAERAHVHLGVAALLAAIAWSVDLVASYALVHHTRETGSKLAIALVSGATLATLLAAGAIALRTYRALPAGEPAHRTWRTVAVGVLVLQGFLLFLLAGHAVPKLLLAPWD